MKLRPLVLFFLFAILAAASSVSQVPLDKAIGDKFTVTKATADRTDIVTAGAVVVLKKDNIVMYATDAPAKSQLVYKAGKVAPSTATRITSFSMFGKPATNIVNRTFVAGEKLWLIDIQTQSDGVNLTLLSDAINNVRYMAAIKFPFPKGTTPSSDQVVNDVSDVISVDGASANAAPAAAPAAPAAPPAPPMAAIAPPPPPADAPPAQPATLEKGQTKDMVVASFGQPVKVVKMGAKEIDYYKDMKVTYVGGKVTDVE